MAWQECDERQGRHNRHWRGAAGHRAPWPASLLALAAYSSAAYGRLLGVKRRYDPDNVFRSNHNIDPAARPGPPGG